MRQNYVKYIIKLIGYLQMMIKSTTMVSKKEKIQQKKEEKKPAMIEVIDLDEQHGDSKVVNHDVNNVGKQDEGRLSQKVQKKVWNIFNLDGLKKYQPEPIIIPAEITLPILRFEQDVGDCQADPYTGRTLVAYSYKESDKIKYVSQNNFQSRVTFVQQEEERNKLLPIEGDKAENSQEEGKKLIRYFSEGLEDGGKKIRCYRCGKSGHIARNCSQQAQKIRCMICLGDHHHQDCTQRLCFRCNGSGHVSQECRSTGIKCQKCKRVGHTQKNCGALYDLDYSEVSDREVRQRFSTSDLKRVRCLHCHQTGHFNCFEYRSKNNVYQRGRQL